MSDVSQTFYSLYALIYLGYLIYGLLLLRRARRWSLLFLLVPIAGLLYDNGVLALARFIGEGETLRILTVGRFCLHFFGTPLLLGVALEEARRFGHRWAGMPLARGLTAAAILAQMIYGFATEVDGLDLAFVVRDGIPRYYAPGPAVASVIVPVIGVIATLAVGFLFSRKNNWPWLFLGALAIFIAEGVTRASDNPALQLVENLGEILFLGAYLLTERFQSLTPETSQHEIRRRPAARPAQKRPRHR